MKRRNFIARLGSLLITAAFVGCQHDPNAHLLTTAEPSRQDVVGVYVLDDFSMPSELSGKSAEIVVEIRPDGTFSATNVPPWELDTPKTDFFESLLSGTGRWEIGRMGTLDPGGHTIWGVYLRDPANKMHPANFTGKKAPYGLMFQLGDPDSGYVVLMKKKA